MKLIESFAGFFGLVTLVAIMAKLTSSMVIFIWDLNISEYF